MKSIQHLFVLFFFFLKFYTSLYNNIEKKKYLHCTQTRAHLNIITYNTCVYNAFDRHGEQTLGNIIAIFPIKSCGDF